MAGGEVASKPDPKTGAAKPLTAVYEVIIPIDNPDLELEPGLRGFAKIDGGTYTLGLVADAVVEQDVQLPALIFGGALSCGFAAGSASPRVRGTVSGGRARRAAGRHRRHPSRPCPAVIDVIDDAVYARHGPWGGRGRGRRPARDDVRA